MARLGRKGTTTMSPHGPPIARSFALIPAPLRAILADGDVIQAESFVGEAETGK